jgi:prepilin-type N-terminal cleavage/methylation domain-containing protein
LGTGGRAARWHESTAGCRPDWISTSISIPKAQRLRPNARRHGFTIIELLTVIAIIAILAAFLFPAIAAVREGGHKTGCMEHMRQIVQALKMYKDDWGVYPEALYGYDIIDQNGIQRARRFLYPQYINSRQTFVCPESDWGAPGQDVDFTQSPPPRVGDDLCMTPGKLMNLGGKPTQGCGYPGVNCPPNQQPLNYYLYPWDSYDGGQYQNSRSGIDCGTPAQPYASPALNYILNYQRRWEPPVPNDPDSLVKQLSLRQPSDQTVVTWCLNHFHVEGGRPQEGSLALVAFLDGRVQSIPAVQMMTWDNAEGNTWKAAPKP